MKGQRSTLNRDPWNKGKLTGQKAPLRLNEIYAIRVRLQLSRRIRDLALFNLAIDSKLRACDLLNLRVMCQRRSKSDPLCVVVAD